MRRRAFGRCLLRRDYPCASARKLRGARGWQDMRCDSGEMGGPRGGSTSPEEYTAWAGTSAASPSGRAARFLFVQIPPPRPPRHCPPPAGLLALATSAQLCDEIMPTSPQPNPAPPHSLSGVPRNFPDAATPVSYGRRADSSVKIPIARPISAFARKFESAPEPRATLLLPLIVLRARARGTYTARQARDLPRPNGALPRCARN